MAKGGMSVEFIQYPEHLDCISMRTDIALRELSNTEALVSLFTGEIARQLADKFVEMNGATFIESIREKVEAEITKLTTEKLFAQVIGKVDAEKVLNSILLHTGRETLKKFAEGASK